MWPALHHGAMSWRRFEVLVEHLPSDSATKRVIVGPAADWSTGEYLLAHLADLLAVSNWQRARGRGQRPKPLPRPGADDRRPRYGGKGKGIPVEQMDRLNARWSDMARGTAVEKVT